jgi:hypothetical protein
MKTLVRTSRRAEGVTLFVTLAICAILSVLIASYLSLVLAQRSSVSRAQSWNSALAVAEAGIEEGMAHINSGVDVGHLATNTWNYIGAGIVGKTNYVGSSYYSVNIQTAPAVTNVAPVVTSTAYVAGPVSGPSLSRTIQVITAAKPSSGGRGAIISNGPINFSGFNVTVDAFDSSNTNYSTGGQYDPNKRLANGDIIAASTATNAIDIGDSKVYGTIHTEPGVTVTVDTKQGAGYSVGDLSYVNSGTVGIESGHAIQDANYTLTDVTLPNVTWTTPTSTKYKFNGTMFNYVLDNSTPWQLSSLSQAVYVSSPNTILYVTTDLSLGSGTEIYIAPGASFTLYCGAQNATVGGQGVVNSSGLAQNFHYYGLPSNTALGLQGNASWSGVVDAPEAFVTLGGGGSSPYDFSGQIVAGQVKLNGHFNVHYDQSVVPGGPPTGFTAASWHEQ